MLETPHAVVGAAIATAIPNPVIALPLAFASHFALDMVPHWNPHLNTELKKYGKITKTSRKIVYFDSFLALSLGGAIAYMALPSAAHATTVLLGAFVGVLPDVVEIPFYFFTSKNKYIESWIKFQKSIQSDTTPLPGLATQVIAVIASFWWILG